MTLTQHERDKFIVWLNRNADDDTALAAQMDKVPSPPTQMLAKKKRAEATACRIVADMLQNTHVETVGGETP